MAQNRCNKTVLVKQLKGTIRNERNSMAHLSPFGFGIYSADETLQVSLSLSLWLCLQESPHCLIHHPAGALCLSHRVLDQLTMMLGISGYWLKMSVGISEREHNYRVQPGRVSQTPLTSNFLYPGQNASFYRHLIANRWSSPLDLTSRCSSSFLRQ